MSLQDSEFIEIKNENEFNVGLLIELKNENDFKVEASTDVLFESRTDTWRWQSNEEEEKCGEIFVSSRGTFTLICVNCNEWFENMQAFGAHIHTKHWNGDRGDSKIASTPQNFDNNLESKSSDLLCSSEGAEIKADPLENICGLLEPPKRLNKPSDSNNLADSKVSDNICSLGRTGSPTEQKWVCELCNLRYKAKSSLTRHNKRHQTPTILESKDDQNTVTNASPKSAVSMSHTQRCREPIVLESSTTKLAVDPKLFCEICNRQFKTKRGFQYHAMHHETVPIELQQDPSYLKCKYCNLEFVDYLEWTQHKRMHKGGRPYACTHCKKTFIRRTDCQMHINSHTGEKPFKCPHCPKAFAHSNNLAWHVKGVHLQLKTFACELCDRRFTRNVELTIHMRQHSGEKPYQCESCGRGFMLAAQMNEHRKRHSNIKDVKCPICGKGFYSKKRLRGHMVKHSDERPHICPVCGHTFAARKALVVHQKLHLDVKQYVCNICGKAFAQAAGLYSHKKSHGVVIGAATNVGMLGNKC